MTASEMPWATCCSMPITMTMAGTMTMPPPTPIVPATNPVTVPAISAAMMTWTPSICPNMAALWAESSSRTRREHEEHGEPTPQDGGVEVLGEPGAHDREADRGAGQRNHDEPVHPMRDPVRNHRADGNRNDHGQRSAMRAVLGHGQDRDHQGNHDDAAADAHKSADQTAGEADRDDKGGGRAPCRRRWRRRHGIGGL